MTTTDVQCPKCGGTMWDNRASKKNPKQPDFKCKDKACDGVIWPPRNASNAKPASAPTQGYSAGPHIPEMDGPYTETGAAPVVQTTGDKLEKMFTLYGVCLDQAIVSARKLDDAKIGSSPEAVAAMCATLFIQATQRGLAA